MKDFRFKRLVTALMLAAPIVLTAAQLQPVYTDAAGTGFNDATLGSARKTAFESALTIWGNQLRSAETIKVAASFGNLPCSSGNATLGAGEPISYLHNFSGAPVQNRLYPVALAEALAGQNLNSSGNEIVVRINSGVDQGCIGSVSGFDYNINPGTATVPNKIRALPVMLHQVAHGLGFFSLFCLVSVPGGCAATAGQWPYGGYPNNVLDRWSDFLRDGPNGNFWNSLTSAQRITSARSGNLVWDGPRVTAALPALNLNAAAMLGNRIKMHSPTVLLASASVNHFSADVTQNLLMKPDYSEPSNIAALDLAPALLADIGWALSTDPVSTTTVITSDLPDPSVINSAYAVNVTVSSNLGAPPGTVTIRDGNETNSASCIATLSAGAGSCSITSTIAGSRTLAATYSGSGVYQVSSDVEGHVVQVGSVDLNIATLAQFCSLNGVPTIRRAITISKVGTYVGAELVTTTIPELSDNLGASSITPQNFWSCATQVSGAGTSQLVCAGNYGVTPQTFFVSQPADGYPNRRYLSFLRDAGKANVVGELVDPTIPNNGSLSLSIDPNFPPSAGQLAPCGN